MTMRITTMTTTIITIAMITIITIITITVHQKTVDIDGHFIV